ncbi:MAG: heme-binding protein [Dehalococcoidaceae bacterium]|nr:heme-binding protein [Dehalococcoidaceae bacterium]
MAVEKLEYIVIEKDGKFEIRDYEGYITAEVEIEGGYNSALLQGFRILADYIFGNNRKKQHIAMTSPVMQSSTASERIEMTAPVLAQKTANDNYLISFVVPRKYTIDTLPEPISGDIRFRTVKAQRVAVVMFSGYLNSRTVTKKTVELKSWLEKKAVEPASIFVSCQYNPPWVPGIFRRNEIMVSLLKDSD